MTNPCSQCGTILIFAALHRPTHLCDLARAGAARRARRGGGRRSSAPCSSSHPRSPTSSPPWSGRMSLLQRHGPSASPIICWARRASSTSPSCGDRRRQSALVLAGAGDGPALAPGRLFHDHFHRGRSGNLPVAVRGRLRGRCSAGLADAALYHPAAAPRHFGLRAAAEPHRGVSGLRRVLQHPGRLGVLGRQRGAGTDAAHLPVLRWP